ncbi:amidohydrolase family protein [Arthrobacter sp. GCM10027362]|uniref:amidohydrolase family protein n=1 Tax=Arthrobacter sp. GCM10027362 TaxID=3273379 RepID=UPI00363AE5E6
MRRRPRPCWMNWHCSATRCGRFERTPPVTPNRHPVPARGQQDGRARKTLIEGVTLVSMDRNIGVVRGASVLVEGDLIGAVGPSPLLRPDDTVDEVVDGRGFILFPGLVNAHMHTWQTALRGIASNWTLLEYFRHTHAGLATFFTAEDIYVGTFAGALNQLNCGTTTLVDWCHNNPTPEHTDAAVTALEHSGIRAAFLHGSPKPEPRPGQRPYWEVPQPRPEIERLAAQPRFGANRLLSLGLAALGPHYSTLEVALADFRLAQDMGLSISVHQGGGAAHVPEGWTHLEKAGLLGPHANIVHGNDLSDEQLAAFVDLGVSFSLTPENEMTQGHGHPITGRLRNFGASPSIGIDLESGLSGELLFAARIALVHQRALDNAAFRAAALSKPHIPETSTLTTLDALRWITVEGARMLGQEERIGSISPGKQADLLLIDARQPNMQPVHDPVNAILMQASLANIHSVMVAGTWRKRAGALVDDGGRPLDTTAWLDPLRKSGERLAAAVQRS